MIPSSFRRPCICAVGRKGRNGNHVFSYDRTDMGPQGARNGAIQNRHHHHHHHHHPRGQPDGALDEFYTPTVPSVASLLFIASKLVYISQVVVWNVLRAFGRRYGVGAQASVGWLAIPPFGSLPV